VFKQVAPESHWPELVALVCVVNANKKAVSSTSGMMNRWANYRVTRSFDV
jgi:diphosphomevalonate decarboxylase